MACDSCGHDWHGLECRHEEIVRENWWLSRVTCSCSDR